MRSKHQEKLQGIHIAEKGGEDSEGPAEGGGIAPFLLQGLQLASFFLELASRPALLWKFPDLLVQGMGSRLTRTGSSREGPSWAPVVASCGCYDFTVLVFIDTVDTGLPCVSLLFQWLGHLSRLPWPAVRTQAMNPSLVGEPDRLRVTQT